MKVTPLLSIMKMLVKSRKMKLGLVGVQFGYMSYKYIKNRKRRKKQINN